MMIFGRQLCEDILERVLLRIYWRQLYEDIWKAAM